MLLKWTLYSRKAGTAAANSLVDAPRENRWVIFHKWGGRRSARCSAERRLPSKETAELSSHSLEEGAAQELMRAGFDAVTNMRAGRANYGTHDEHAQTKLAPRLQSPPWQAFVEGNQTSWLWLKSR